MTQSRRSNRSVLTPALALVAIIGILSAGWWFFNRAQQISEIKQNLTDSCSEGPCSEALPLLDQVGGASSEQLKVLKAYSLAESYASTVRKSVQHIKKTTESNDVMSNQEWAENISALSSGVKEQVEIIPEDYSGPLSDLVKKRRSELLTEVGQYVGVTGEQVNQMRPETAMKEAAAQGKLQIGMTEEHVITAIGSPRNRSRHVSAYGVTEYWHYDPSPETNYTSLTLTMQNGILESWSER